MLTLPPPTRPTFYFIGVSTAHSSSRRVWPAWMDLLGLPQVALQGVDLAPGSSPDLYRQVVAGIKQEPLALGGLVTTHKIDLLEAAADLFDELGPYAALCREVSSISKVDGRLVGHATDPVAGGQSLDELLGPGYFGRTGGHLLCLGAGGAAAALAVHLLRKPDGDDRPARMVAVDMDGSRLARFTRLAEQMGGGARVQGVLDADPQGNDARLAALPPHSVVINATGMGKDRPGSPITPAALFPEQAMVWELNYRGELPFLHQARAQQEWRGLTVADGWGYFIRGWAGVMGHVLHVSMDDARLVQLAAAAQAIR